jgi:DNA-binding LytR/AlgR family response regulator
MASKRVTKKAPAAESPILVKILERLQSIDPPIKRFPVLPPDPAMAFFLLALCEVCYITTRSDAGRAETALVTSSGETFYTNLGLDAVAKRLKDHPHFLRTSRFYIVNMAKVQGYRISNARDLWFDGLDKPVVNAVTATYLPAFEAWLSG